MNMRSAVLPLVLGFVCAGYVFGAHDAQALTISPVKVEVAGDAGQTLRGEMELLNEQADLRTFYSSFDNFEPDGDTGSPRFVGSANGLATWLATESSVTLASGQKLVVPYTITIPSTAEAGGYFSAVFWGEQNPAAQGAGEVSVGGKLGVLIMLRVNGDIVEDGGITEFGLDPATRFATMVPLTFAYRFSNAGGDRVVPLGDLVVKNSFGGTTVTLPANPNEGSVLPGSARRFTTMWGDSTDTTPQGFLAHIAYQARNFHVGLYTAELRVLWGTSNTPAEATYRFFILPWQLLLTIGAGLIVLIFMIRRYNAWIIARHR